MQKLLTAKAGITSTIPTNKAVDEPVVDPNGVPLPPILRDTVAVLVPARNEAEQIASTIQSLWRQTRRPDFILVIVNNTVDSTAAIARENGATVIEMTQNKHKKAGALNAGVRHLLSGRYFPEFVVTIDGDTELEEHFVQRSLKAMAYEPKLGGLSAVCRGKPRLGHTPVQRILTWYQRAEYARAGFVRLRRNVHTLSGAGSVLRAEAIYDVLCARRDLYEERPTNIVEDFETTLEMKRLGWRCTNNYHTVAYTDLMLSLRTLFQQRIRWVGGTIDELRRRGWCKETRASIITLAYGFLGMPVFYFWVWLFMINILNGADLVDIWFTGCVALYQGLTLRKMGWRSMILGALLVPEALYMLTRHSWLIASLGHSYLVKRRVWR